MMMDEAHSKLIDKYLRHELSKMEQNTFQNLMRQAAFAEEVDFRRQLVGASRDLGRSSLTQLFEEADQELDEEAEAATISIRSSRNRWYRWAGVAAAILLLSVFLLWPSPPSNQELFAAHYSAFPNLIAPGDRSGDAQETLDLALKAYESADFAEAIRLFEDISDKNQNEVLYYGLSLLMDGKNQEAIQHIQIVATDSSARYQAAAQWYLALAYLKTDDQEASQSLLQEIVSTTDHPYRTKAIDLDESL